MILDHITTETTISIIGLAKNTGKTVTLNKLISEFEAHGVICGITSIGYDGEKYDSINKYINKPRIKVFEGNLVATTDQLLKNSKVLVQFVSNTDYRTSLGNVNIYKIVKEGYIEIAGPSTISGIIEISKLFQRLGASKVIIDGAINRRASSSPEVCDGYIVSTGAVLDKNMNRVVFDTQHLCRLLNLRSIKIDNFDRLKKESKLSRLSSINDETVYISNHFLTGNDFSIFNKLDADVKYIIFDTSLVENVAEKILYIRKKRPITLVLENSRKIFIKPNKLTEYSKRGLELRVLKKNKLISITLNPISPQAHEFDSDEFLYRMKKEIPDIPIFDVNNPKYQ